MPSSRTFLQSLVTLSEWVHVALSRSQTILEVVFLNRLQWLSSCVDVLQALGWQLDLLRYRLIFCKLGSVKRKVRFLQGKVKLKGIVRSIIEIFLIQFSLTALSVVAARFYTRTVVVKKSPVVYLSTTNQRIATGNMRCICCITMWWSVSWVVVLLWNTDSSG